MQDLQFCDLETPGGSSTQWILNSYDKLIQQVRCTGKKLYFFFTLGNVTSSLLLSF